MIKPTTMRPDTSISKAQVRAARKPAGKANTVTAQGALATPLASTGATAAPTSGRDSADKGLFERWLAIERDTGRSMTTILADLNAAAGTAYKHNWPTKQAATGYALERLPTAVREYMMRIVMPNELSKLGFPIENINVEKLVKALT
jgi:hypothetical protein